MADYIPESYSKFHLWQTHLIKAAEPKYESWGIPTEYFANVKASQAIWVKAFDKASNKHNRTSADVLARVIARKDHEKVLRLFVRQWLSYNTNISDSERTSMSITVRAGTHVRSPKPSSSPSGRIRLSNIYCHNIHFTDRNTFQSKAKPKGVYGCEIWMKLGTDAYGDTSELTYVTLCTRTPYLATYPMQDAGKVVCYVLRWINTRGEVGPWSSPFSAIIPG